MGDPDLGDLRRFCSSAFYPKGAYGLAGDIYFIGEEVGREGDEGQLYALDVANNMLYAAPATGRAAYENVTLLDSGDPSKVALAIGGRPGECSSAPVPGEKRNGGGFLERNGLAQGKLYAWVADNGDRSSDQFYRTDQVQTRRFVEVHILDEGQAEAEGRDAAGYASLALQDSMADALGAFKFSRPEDLDVNPENGTQFVLNSTGHRSYPNDLWGTVYVVDVDFSDLSAEVRIVYSGDDGGGGQFRPGPDFGLRSPDNLDWADDGYVYFNEDWSTGGFGLTSGQEASVWQMDRIAQVNRKALLPLGARDTDPDDLAYWETSGVLDVTTLFGAASTTLLINVQAHSLSVDLFGDLVQGGQMVLLRKTKPQDVGLTRLGSVTSELGAAIVAYDPVTLQAFVSAGSAVEVIDLSDPREAAVTDSIDMSDMGEVTSVAVRGGVPAVAVNAEDKAANGLVAFYSTVSVERLNTVATGVLPDMVTFSPDGRYVLTANEGEPNEDYTLDPAGTVTVVDLTSGVEQASARTVGFDPSSFNVTTLRARGLRVFGPRASLANDLEPEYITISPDSSTAYVTLQENNAIAVVDIAGGRDGGISLRSWPALGMYQPDVIASYLAGDGRVYLVTANEGDARDYTGFSEEARVKDLTLAPAAFQGAAGLQEDGELGRLKTTTTLGDTDNDGDYDVIYSYGARSFSIWDTSGNLVFDSESDIGAVTATRAPAIFNSNGQANTWDSRSDDKGAELGEVVVAKVGGRYYGFVGLERTGGILIYDVTYPTNARFVDYMQEVDPYGERFTSGDIGTEGLAVVPAEESPTGAPLLPVANEWSQTTVYEIMLSGR